MPDIASALGTIRDLVLFLIGFGLIVFIHELGHFLAARWAGIRVMAFAVGFGPALASYRRGFGFRFGSSEPEYRAMLRADSEAEDRAAGVVRGVHPTEYRFNVLPFGGYVKMLGQEDMNPNAVSDAADSYQNCKPWKRLVVISAGVVMNLILAAALFIVVFMAGLKTEPAWVGSVVAGLPASKAVAENASEQGVTSPGLQPGDRITRINGANARTFSDLVLATAMSKKGVPIELIVEREGLGGALTFRVTPEEDRLTGLLALGIEPARSARIVPARSEKDAVESRKVLDKLGLRGVEPAMRLTRAGEIHHIRSGNDLASAMAQSHGRPVQLEFADDSGKTAKVTLQPIPAMQEDLVTQPGGSVVVVEHVLGLTPVMTVRDATPSGSGPKASRQGLRDGDVFARIGAVEFPSVAQGMAEIKSHAGKPLDLVVIRKDDSGVENETPLKVKVSRKGTIGFTVGDTGDDRAIVSMPQKELTEIRQGATPRRPAANDFITVPGTRIVSIGGQRTSNFGEIREALRAATRSALIQRQPTMDVPVVIELPRAGVRIGEGTQIEAVWPLAESDIRALHSLGWTSPVGPGLFDAAEFSLKASSPIEAIVFGLSETKRVVLTTYVTFLRLAQGSVKVEHLKGPVGIAHMGTLITSRGVIWLLFFLALISVNLAVINFLPLPIVDGGQFLLILFEQLRGRPVPLGFQNGLTLAGLVLIGCVFLLVTYNDVKYLFGL